MTTDVINKIKDADMILIGIGEEMAQDNANSDELITFYNKLGETLKDKNYFVVSISQDTIIYDSNLSPDYITTPYSDKESISPEGVDKQWDKYMKWLSCTLNRKLLVMEFGVLLSKPNVIRWPFERVVMLNEKSHLIRINNTIPQLPSELSARATSIKDNPLYFFDSI